MAVSLDSAWRRGMSGVGAKPDFVIVPKMLMPKPRLASRQLALRAAFKTG
jgi:hypothetical protein